jgi:hypothetical protein
MYSIPLASRILPLTKRNFDGLLAASHHPGKVLGHFVAYSVPPTDEEDEEPVGRRHSGYLINVQEPDHLRCYGPDFNTFYCHDSLTEWIRKLCPGHDLGMPLELTGDEECLSARLIPEFRPKIRDRSLCVAYASENQGETRWTKPPHDQDFVRRALPALYRDQEHEFTYGEWSMNQASSPAAGIIILHGRERMLAAVDRDRYPQDVEGARSIKEARVLLIDISPSGCGGAGRYSALSLVSEMGLGDYTNHLLRKLAFEAGVPLPQPLERRWFFWQTYLDGAQHDRRLR